MSVAALPSPRRVRASPAPAPLEAALDGAVELVAMHFPVGELKVLDAGDGSPPALSRLRGATVTVLQAGAPPGQGDADLDGFQPDPDRYQVAVCSHALDRVADPQAALRRLAKALAPGGLLMVCGAIPTSFLGLLRRVAPAAGKRRTARRLPGPDGLKDLAAGLGLELVYEALTPRAWPQAPALTGAYQAGMLGLRVATAGLWRPELSEMVLVFRRD